MGEITCSNVKEEMMMSRACAGELLWDRNHKEMLKDKLKHVWKDREIWSSSQ